MCFYRNLAAMEDKKLHIIQNVARLYLKFGIGNVTMDNIASESRISKKTLYQYFSDKEDLVSHVVDHFINDTDVDFGMKAKGNAIDNMFDVRRHVAGILKFYNNNIEYDLKNSYPLLYKKIHETKRQRIFENTVENLKLGINQGFYRTGLDPFFIAKLQIGRMLFTLNPDYGIFKEYEVSTLAFFDNMMDYHMSAICTEKGLKYYKKQLNKLQNED